MNQAHHKFKVFLGHLGQDHTLGALAGEIEAFVRDAGVAPKSIGAEFLEGSGQILVSLGYRDDEPAQPVQIRTVPVGKVEPGTDLTHLADALTRAAAAQGDVLCHELYVTHHSDLFMIFMIAV